MKKEILLIWFGDHKPAYVDWNVENFRRINPTWDINYVNYTLSQIDTENDDACLNVAKKTMKDSNISLLSHLADFYKHEYLRTRTEEGIYVYLDLDCFPIAPLDKFFVCDKNGVQHQRNVPVAIDNSAWFWTPSSISLDGKESFAYVPDIGFLYTIINQKSGPNYYFKYYSIQQIVASTDFNKPISYYQSYIINEDVKDEVTNLINSRKALFANCRLAGNICSTEFTPVEHYFMHERLSL